MYGKAARWMSLLGASALALVILLYPIALSRDGTMPPHGMLTLVMLGICVGFVHGVGFTPEMGIGRAAFHPIVGWVLMALGFFMIFFNQG